MEDIKKHAILLSLLAILLIAKFVVVPIFMWQDQILVEIKEQEKKLGKTALLLAKEDGFNRLNQQIEQQLEQAEQLFYPYQTGSAFKLQQQKHFEDLVLEHQLTLSSFSWQANSEDKELQIMRYQVRVRLKGNISRLVSFISALESQKQRVEVYDFNISMKGQNKQSLGRTKNAVFTLRFYVNNKTNLKEQ
jgi:hypothetical protein